MPRSHLHVKVRPERATTYHEDNFLEIELDVAHSWQLLGLCGCYGVFVAVGRGSFVAVTGSLWLSRCLRGCYGVNVPLFLRKYRITWLLRDRFT